MKFVVKKINLVIFKNIMSSLVTFIYCFDENYNRQAATSILSLLRNIDKEVDIKIIHKNKDSFDKYLKIISNEIFFE